LKALLGAGRAAVAGERSIIRGMMTTYQLNSGDRPIALREAFTAQQALFDYLRSLGCKDEDIMKLAPDAVSWRGAVYQAVPVSSGQARC